MTHKMSNVSIDGIFWIYFRNQNDFLFISGIHGILDEFFLFPNFLDQSNGLLALWDIHWPNDPLQFERIGE